MTARGRVDERLPSPVTASPRAGMTVTPPRHTGLVQSPSIQFSTTARLLSTEARRAGLVVPGFRSPPRLPGADRSIRRRPDGAVVVAVRLRGRAVRDIAADMVEGVLVANALQGSDAQSWRSRLRSVVCDAEQERAA